MTGHDLLFKNIFLEALKKYLTIKSILREYIAFYFKMNSFIQSDNQCYNAFIFLNKIISKEKY